MATTSTLSFCLNTQQAMDDALAQSSNPKFQVQERFGTTLAVNSPVNRQGFEFEYDVPRARPTSSSNRKVSIYGNPKNCKTVQTSAIDVCAGTTAETTDLIDTQLTVENYRGITRTYDRALYRDTCDTSDGRAAQKIAENLFYDALQIIKQENDDLIDAIIAGRDNYFDGTSSVSAEKTLPLYSSTVPRVPQPGNLFIALNEYQRKGYGVTPQMVGGGYLDRFMYDANFYTGDMSATGRDLSKAPAPIPEIYTDWQVDAVFADGGAHALTWTPGHVQMLYWNDYASRSPLRRSTGTITYTTLVIDLPFIGPQEFDYVVYDADCDHEIDVTLSRYSNPWIIPSTFFAGTACGGQQSVLSWSLDCADTTCTDIVGPIVT